MDMVDDRIATEHIYNKQTADDIAQKIIDSYYSAFLARRVIIKMDQILI